MHLSPSGASSVWESSLGAKSFPVSDYFWFWVCFQTANINLWFVSPVILGDVFSLGTSVFFCFKLEGGVVTKLLVERYLCYLVILNPDHGFSSVAGILSNISQHLQKSRLRLRSYNCHPTYAILVLGPWIFLSY